MKHFFPGCLLLLLALLFQACEGDTIDWISEESEGDTSGTVLVSPELSWSVSSFDAILGVENDFPVLSNPHDVAVSYSSSDTEVATVSSDGTITLVSAGETTVSAASSETSVYESATVSYTLTVTKQASSVSWSSSSCTAVLGAEDNAFPTLSNPGGQTVEYSSSNTSVATIDPTSGEITLAAVGETTITAATEASDSHEAGSVSYTLTVESPENTLQSAGLEWSETSFTATLAMSNTFPTLSNPNGLSVTYTSSNTDIATVDGQGVVTLVGAGTAAIIASSEATDEYAAGSASYTLKVVKCEVTLSWPSSSYTAVLEAGFSAPALSVLPEDATLDIEYSSSNTAVASVDAQGKVTLSGAGSATISATFSGNDAYKSASASYSLVVTSSEDTGAGTYTYSSTGDTGSDDDISNTTFTRKITVHYSTSEEASVTGDAYGYVTVSGNQVTVNNTGTECIVYELTGTTTNGFFKLYSTKKQAILLNGVSITNPSGSAINNQSGKRTFVMVEGTNTLADGSSAAYTTSGDEDMKAVLFSEGQLVLSGSGSLTVTVANKQGKSGIVSDDYVRIMDAPVLKVTAGSSAGHGIRGKEYVRISDGTLTVSTSAAMKKGIGSDDYVLVEGGSTTLTISGGVGYDSDDAEYKGSAGIKADNYFGMTGGTVTIQNTGAGGKGISAGSYDYDESKHTLTDSYISGGTLSITTTGSESHDVSSKGIKIGWVTKSGNNVTGYAGNLVISGGKIQVSCSKSESLEAKGNLTISAGEVYAASSGDDAINCQGELNVTGGYVYAYSSANDAMDANHDLKLSGGYVFSATTAGSPEVAIDANTEGGYKLYVESGATVVAYGGLESGASISQTCYTMSCNAGAWNALYGGNAYIAAFKAPSGVSSVVVSAPSLSSGYKGVSVSGTTRCSGIWATSGISGGTVVSLGTYSGGGGTPGGGGGNPGGGGGRNHR